jgi:hypothetical protein
VLNIHFYLKSQLDENGDYEQGALGFITELILLAASEENYDSNLLKFVLQAKINGKMVNAFDDSFLSSVNPYMFVDTSNADLPPNLLWEYLSIKCAVLRNLHPDWSDLKIYWEASKDIIHITLDLFGLIPLVGEVADLTNGVLYLIEGEGVDATLSFAATIPFAGWTPTVGKYMFKLTATSIGTKVRLTWKVLADGKIYFGSSGSKLRKVLGITDSSLQAHHIMPWTSEAVKNHDVIQKVASSQSAFHMNEALNGIPVASWRNQPNHPVYTNLVESKLDEFNLLNPDASLDEAYDFVSDLIADIESWIVNNPSLHLNNLVLP